VVHIVHALRMQSQVFASWPQMPHRCGRTKAKHTQSTRCAPAPIWYCRVPRNHNNDTEDVARGQWWSTSCMHHVCKAELSLLVPKCRIGAAEPRQNKRNPHLALQDHLVFAGCHKTTTTTPKTSQEVSGGPYRACTTYTKLIFRSLAPNAASVRPNQGKTQAIHAWCSRAQLVLPGAANDTRDVARCQWWSTSCMHRVCKAEFLLLGPKYSVGAAEPRRSTRNPRVALQGLLVPGPSGTAGCRKTTTTTPKTSLEVNDGPYRGRTTYA